MILSLACPKVEHFSDYFSRQLHGVCDVRFWSPGNTKIEDLVIETGVVRNALRYLFFSSQPSPPPSREKKAVIKCGVL